VYDETSSESLDFCLEDSLDFINSLLFVSRSFTDSPQDVKLACDEGSETLSVAITHPSSFPRFHFTKYVEINNRGGTVKNTYENQLKINPTRAPFGLLARGNITGVVV